MLTCIGNSGLEGPLKMSDLNGKEMGKILTSYTGELVHVKNVFYTPPSGEWFNDNFTSNITKLKVVTEDEKEYHIIAKATKNHMNGFNSFFSSINRFFYKEYIWYKVARPLLSQKWSIVEELSPNIYYGNVNTGITLEKTWCQDTFGPLALLLKKEKSILLLENMCEKPKEERFEVINKYDNVSLDIALAACKSMAHFHGVWKQFLYNNSEATPEGSHTSPQDFMSTFETEFGTWSYQKLLEPFKKMCRDMILNNLTEKDAGEYMASRYFSYVNSEEADVLIKDMFTNTKADNSKLKTMNHGDLWSNNILYRPNDKKVILIDFQLMQISHPARDFWNFIYTSTDKEMRESHLEEIKRSYFEVYSDYLKPNFEMSYEEFSNELEERRGVALLLPLVCLMISKYPEKIDPSQIILFGSDYKEMMSTLANKEKETDHPRIKRVRKLIIDAIHEASNLGIFRKNKHV